MSRPDAVASVGERGPEEGVAWHALPVDEVFRLLRTSYHGLSREESHRRLAEQGPNELRREERESPLAVLLKQLKEFLILLLIGAGLISIVLGEYLDAGVILAIVVLSAFLGFLQEYRASRALDALKRLAAPVAAVVRDGQEDRVLARDLVLGDLVLIAAGDRVPADLRVIEEYNLKTSEASLTGESEPVAKDTAPLPAEATLGDRTNMLFAGTTAVYGRGAGVVVATGMNSEFGKIARLLQTPKHERTPLEVQMEVIGRWLGVGGMVVVAIIMGLGLLRGEGLLPTFLWGISLAVAAVPEALPAVVTGALTVGVQRMARRNAIVRRLPAVETLGSTTVICTDKTGTLTTGEMTVRRIWLAGETLEVTGVGYRPKGEIRRMPGGPDGRPPADDAVAHSRPAHEPPHAAAAIDGRVAEVGSDLSTLLRVAVLCNDARLRFDEETERHDIIGDPTEAALLVAAAKAGIEPEHLRLSYPRLEEVPFTSDRKMMTTLNDARTQPPPTDGGQHGAALVCTKGAAEVVLRHCSSYQKDRQVLPLTDEVRREVAAAVEAMARQALRVLGLAYRYTPSLPSGEIDEGWERNLVFCGLMAMSDPPRPEVKLALRQAEAAGVRTVMITGDHKLTATSIAEELGILKEGQTALAGRDLDRLSDADLDGMIDDVAVYARVSPEHKLRIVAAFRRKGQVTAMTGDGLNDAPALRQADIGIAMGITGTEVTREAADLVLTDDNFATIVAAMEEGRGIYDNVKKYLAFLLSSNAGEIVVMFVAGLLGLPLPLIAVQILWANLVTDGLPAIALGIEPPERDVMRRPPRPRGRSVFTPGVLMLIVVVGTLMAAGTLFLFARELETSGDLIRARTMAFTTIVMFEMFNAFNCRSERYSIFQVGPFGNRWLVLAVTASIALQLVVLYVPAFRPVFDVTALTLLDWALILAIASTAVVGAELGKRFVASRNWS